MLGERQLEGTNFVVLKRHIFQQYLQVIHCKRTRKIPYIPHNDCALQYTAPNSDISPSLQSLSNINQRKLVYGFKEDVASQNVILTNSWKWMKHLYFLVGVAMCFYWMKWNDVIFKAHKKIRRRSRLFQFLVFKTIAALFIVEFSSY